MQPCGTSMSDHRSNNDSRSPTCTTPTFTTADGAAKVARWWLTNCLRNCASVCTWLPGHTTRPPLSLFCACKQTSPASEKAGRGGGAGRRGVIRREQIGERREKKQSSVTANHALHRDCNRVDCNRVDARTSHAIPRDARSCCEHVLLHVQRLARWPGIPQTPQCPNWRHSGMLCNMRVNEQTTVLEPK